MGIAISRHAQNQMIRKPNKTNFILFFVRGSTKTKEPKQYSQHQVEFQLLIYLIHHISAETLNYWEDHTLGTNDRPGEVSNQ